MSDVAGVYDDGEAWDDTPDIDPLQVGIRLHELRIRIEELAGVPATEFFELSEDGQTLAAAFGQTLVAFFMDRPKSSAAEMAETIHNVRRFFAALLGQRITAWDDLEEEQRDLSVSISQEIIDWLRREGPR